MNKTSQSTMPFSTVSSTGMYFGGSTDIGRVRDHNEDSFLISAPLFAVADGMGGHEAGEIASEITIQTLAEIAPDHLDAQKLEQAVVAANLNVMRAPAQGVGRDGMGTTLTAAMLEHERLLIAQVGDSRAYLLHHGDLQQITRDHSLMADMIDAGQITELEARYHPNRSVITRAIGSDPYMRPDIYELNVAPGDRLLLCSDGLNTMLEDKEIEFILCQNRDPQKCSEALIKAALQAGGHDNVTAIVVDVQGFNQVRRKKAARKSRVGYTLLGLLLVAVIALAAFAGYAYVDNSAYLIAENGKVCVYKGIPDTLLGIPLSSLDHTTDVDVDKLPAGVAERIKKGLQVESLDAADDLIKDYQQTIAQSEQTVTDAVTHTDATSSQSSSNGGE